MDASNAESSSHEAAWAEAWEELRWLERFALRLVGDADEARDLSQEALLASVRHQGESSGPRRAWLTGVLKNLAFKAKRGRRRRRDYEERGAHPEAIPSAEELASRAELQQRLLAFVADLPEHYRTPLLLRYYEELPVRSIATELQLPVRTVHTRLHRGMKLLREAMRVDDPGERAKWMGGLLPCAAALRESGPRPGPAPRGSAVGGIRRLLSWQVGGAALLTVLVAAAGLIPRSTDPSPRSSRFTARSASNPPEDSVDPPRAVDRVLWRRPLETNRGESAPAVAAPPITGVVLDWDERPVADALVRGHAFQGVRFPVNAWSPTEAILGAPLALSARTDSTGRFELPSRAESVLLQAEADGFVCAIAGVWATRERRDDPFLVLAPSMDLERRVLDHSGAPVIGANAWVSIDESVAATFHRPFIHQHRPHWAATSDANGWLRFPTLPAVPEARLTVHTSESGASSWPLLEAPAQLVLGPQPLSPLRGTVVDFRGRPVHGALVHTGERSTLTGSDGVFELACEELPRELWLTKETWAPTQVSLDQSLGTGPHRTLTLGERAAGLRGRVTDREGKALSGLLVWLVNPTLQGLPSSPAVLESLAAGGDGYRHSARTDSQGRFRLGGLRPTHAYELRVLDSETAQWSDFGPFQPAHELQPLGLRFPKHELLPRLEGQLVARDGEPLVGASVCVQGPGYGVGEALLFEHGAGTATDRDGRFVLENVPARGVWLRAEHPRILLTTAPIEERNDRATWSVALRARLAVELSDPSGDADLELRDASGQALTCWTTTGLGQRAVTRVALYRGRSPLLEVPSDATELLILRAGEDPEHVPIRLTPGRTLKLSL